jgi:hypothetical protein
VITVDGVAALRCWPIDLDIVGRQHRIGPRPALDWIVAMTGSWADIVPGLVDPDDLDLTDRIARGEVGYGDLATAARDAIAAAAGLPWWVAMRLVQISTANLSVAGELAASTDATRISLAAWCAATYQTIARHADDKQRAKLDRDLTTTPPGMVAREGYDEAAAADAFEAMFSARGGA